MSCLLFVAVFQVCIWSADIDFRSELEETIELINSRLSHSQIMRVNDKGIVRIKAPDQLIEFPIQEVSFNYNDSDHRIRIAGDFNIKYFDHDGELDEISHRQSFTCGSKRMAQEAIDAFRRIKQLFMKKDGEGKHLSRSLPVADPSLGYETLEQAIGFINDNLVLSLILDVTPDGTMVINAPSAIYRVNMKSAHFSLNELSQETKVRVYGDWCIEVTEEDDRQESRFVPRESFASRSGSRARQCVRALYYIKGALLGQTSAQVEDTPNLKNRGRENYSNIEEAIEYINDRLEISIVTGIDEDQVMTVNSSDYIYELPIRDCRFRSGRNRISIFGLGLFGGRDNSVEIVCRKGMERYEDRELQRRIDSEQFSIRSRQSVAEVIEALEYIQNKLK